MADQWLFHIQAIKILHSSHFRTLLYTFRVTQLLVFIYLMKLCQL